MVVEDWDAETRFEQPKFGGRRTGAGLSVKIEGRSREAFGVLVVQSMAPRSFASGDVDFLQALANVLADALERQAIEDAIRDRAVHDPLTGLPNRVLFVDRLEHAVARVGRQGSLAEWNSWIPLLSQPNGRFLVANGIERSAELLVSIVERVVAGEVAGAIVDGVVVGAGVVWFCAVIVLVVVAGVCVVSGCC